MKEILDNMRLFKMYVRDENSEYHETIEIAAPSEEKALQRANQIVAEEYGKKYTISAIQSVKLIYQL